ncbi:hypothetical protein FKP32DRAFT_1673510 [Trametes sanguinea]|nr:hypothetical protein FKP32DRAFT_1673510 [Trametes sanguinea]
MDDLPTSTVKEGFGRCALHALQALSPGFGCSGPSLLACVCKNHQFWKVALPYIEKTCGDVETDRAAHVQHELCASGHRLSASGSVTIGFDTDMLRNPGGIPSYAMVFIGFGVGIVVLLVFGVVAEHLGWCGTRRKQHRKDYIPLSSTDDDAALVGHTGFGDAEEGSFLDDEQASGSAAGFVVARVHKSLLGHPLVISPSQQSASDNKAATQLYPDQPGDDSSIDGVPPNVSTSEPTDICVDGGAEPPPPYDAGRSESV